MSFDEILIAVMAGFAVLGAIDRIFGNRLGLGQEFENGVLAMGSLALAMVGLGLLSIPAVNDALVLRANWLPFAIWAAMVALGVVIGRLASKSRQKSASRTMYADVLQHPVVREMLDKGWFPISRESRVKVVFSKSRRVRGLGTAIRSSGEETH